MGSWEPPSFQAVWASDASSEWASTPKQEAPSCCAGFHSLACRSLGVGAGVRGFCLLFYFPCPYPVTFSRSPCLSFSLVWLGFGVCVYWCEVSVGGLLSCVLLSKD